jgi:hypothetical protein
VNGGLSLLDDDGFKLTVTVAWDTDSGFSKLAFDGLLAVSIAAIASRFALTRWFRGLFLQMRFHLCIQTPLYQGCRQLFENALVA